MLSLGLIPTVDWDAALLAPWRDNIDISLPIILMGFAVASCCGLVGVFLILRRMALTGDAISHSLLPGIALSYLISASRDPWIIFIGALLSGLFSVVLIEWLSKKSKLKEDAAIGTVFTSLFALGVFIISYFSGHIDLDTECVLYGELGLISIEPSFSLGSLSLGPKPLLFMLITLFVLCVTIALFYKELLTSSFDKDFAYTLRLRPQIFYYALLIGLSLILVSAFRSVGAILSVGMLLFPGCTALLFSKNLKFVLSACLLFPAIYSMLGYHLAIVLDCSIAASMCSVAFLIFLAFFAIKRIQAFIQ